ncbi:hypothetical protein [Aerococcus vaginalis]
MVNADVLKGTTITAVKQVGVDVKNAGEPSLMKKLLSMKHTTWYPAVHQLTYQHLTKQS